MSEAERFVKKMIKDYRQGDSLRTIGSRYGISHETVSKTLTAFGEPIRRRGNLNKLLPSQIASICQNYNGETLDELAKKYKVCSTTISRVFKNNNITPVKRRQYIINSAAFNTLNIPSVYWLGYLYAQAFIKSKYHLEVSAPNDQFHTGRLCKFRSFLNTQKDFLITKTRIRLIITCKELVDRLIVLGVAPIIHLRFPPILTTPSLQIALIRGYFDGRGTVTRVIDGYDLDIVSNPQFLQEIRSRLTDLAHVKGQKVSTKRLRYSGETARSVAQVLAMSKFKTAKMIPNSEYITQILKYHARKESQ